MLVAKKHKRLILNLRDPERVTTIIPTAKELNWRGHRLVAVPHKLDEVRVLRNLGFDAPAPMGSYYDWPGQYKPFAHQQITAEFLTLNPRAFLLSGLGSGKTISTLWAYHYLRSIGAVKRMLVVSPLSTLERAWGDEIFKHFPDLTFAVLHGTRERRHKLLANDFDIYLINHDGLKSEQTIKLLRDKEGLDIVVVDEVASFRNSQTDRWRFLNQLINGAKKTGEGRKEWAWGLTGTPTPNGPTDAWAQVKLINPPLAKGYFGAFRDQVMMPQGPYKWTMREGALGVVHNMMQPSIRFATEDCVDLPPTTYLTRQADLSPEQKKAFKEMLSTLKAEIGSGQITAVNEAVKLGKLVQILLGEAYSANGVVSLPNGPRVDVVREVIEQADAKVIVFVPLTAALESLAAALRRDFTVGVVHGGTSKAERDRVFNEFQGSANPRVLVANPSAMQHGLTLTRANTTVWFGPTTSNEVWNQANARTVRPGQKLRTFIVKVEATELEQKMYARLEGKTSLQGILLDLVKNQR